ncbi:NACHT domain-containing protein [Streptomyces chartreusis]|uniref:NACHT domain-containing protein n=1 Tax=Streptomyces chartreusis TaxID=1969 RepID=UPI0036C16330
MGPRRLLSFGDALVLLGEDPPAMAALDRAIAGALNLATGGLSSGLLGMFDSRGRVLGLGRAAAHGVSARLGRAQGRVERTQLLDAAHTVIVVLAFFEVLEEALDALVQEDPPLSLNDLLLSRREQISVVGGRPVGGEGFAQTMMQVDAPHPAPHLPYEDTLVELRTWYGRLSLRVVNFLRGLALWEELPASIRSEIADTVHEALPRRAIERYQGLYSRLVVEAPEFRYWSGRLDHQATRAELRRSLTGLEQLLSSVVPRDPPVDVAQSLSRAHQAALHRRILDTETAPEGMRVPTLEEAYLDPDFRVRAVDGQGSPGTEEWWEQAPARQDLTEYLTGALTSEGLTLAPLLVLGQPGAGKSVLTRILAARLPAAGFLPVRVALRDVRADDELQDQLEHAVRDITGEQVTWPSLVRSAGTALPVLLLDGFDELLQTTGVHQNDFLVKVARFQEREWEQGRPVVALVTSRTTVADRVRYPLGTVALRLEPFRQAQIEAWVRQWNLSNARHFTARRLPELSWDMLEPHHALAGQPLLLTMLALYHAAGNDLRGTDERPLGEADLYEALLGSFARREVAKEAGDVLRDAQVEDLLERELQRLSLVAFAMLNRRRQWASTAELEEDLVALLGRHAHKPSSFREPLSQADITLGRFFFVQRAQSIRGGQTLSTYEFLHATFGEYLAARLAVQLLTRLLEHRPVFSMGSEPLDDDMLFALLSFAPVFSRQMLRFARARLEQLTEADRERLAGLVIRALGERELRADQPYPAYLPQRLRATTRHGIYSANLVMFVLLLTKETTASTLFPAADDPGDAWHSRALLWRSSFEETQWTDFAMALSLQRTRNGTRRDLTIRLRQGDQTKPEATDAHWLYRVPREPQEILWQRAYWREIWHKMDVAAGTNDGVVLQALRPLLESLGPLLTTFNGGGSSLATSILHDLLKLWLHGGAGMSLEETQMLYRRVGNAFLVSDRDSPLLRHLRPVLVSLLDRDLQRFPAQDAQHFAEALSAHAPAELNELLQGRVEAARHRAPQGE